MSHFLWTTSLTSEKFIGPFKRDGLVHHTVGHVSCSEMWSCVFDFSSVPVLLLTFIASVFPKHLNIGIASAFSQRSCLGTHGN